MPQYMIIAKYSTTGAAGAVKDGFAKRQQAGNELAESVGGKMVSWCWLRSPNWDLAAVIDVPDGDTAVAINLVGRPTGAFEAFEMMEVLDSTQMDRIAGTLSRARYQPPGSAT